MTPSKKKKGFFAVDIRCFAEACADVNMATSYLVLASGTGGDHVTTSWSVNAIEKYTSISRSRGSGAVDRLIRNGLVFKVAGGSNPRYKLATWAQFSKLAPDPAPLSEEQMEVLEVIRRCGALSSKQKTVANHLARLQRVRSVKDDFGQIYFQVVVPPEPKQAFIPNTFVTGAAGETPPLERLRRLQDPLLLRLAVDLYHVHLENDGGIAKNVIFREYTRELKAEFGPYLIYEFRADRKRCYGGEILNPHIMTRLDNSLDLSFVSRRFDALEKAGLIEWIPILFEGPALEAEPLFPLGYGDTDSIEDRLGAAAQHAAARMLSRRYNLTSDAPALRGPLRESQLVPVYRDFAEATLIGIARLRYRPHTARTTLWFSKVEDRGAEYLEKWQQIIDGIDLHAQDEDFFNAA